MRRIARVVVPHHPHRIVQRGHRQVIFLEPTDYARHPIERPAGRQPGHHNRLVTGTGRFARENAGSLARRVE